MRRIEAGENVSALARELEIKRAILYRWRDAYRLGGSEALRLRGRPSKAEAPKPSAARLGGQRAAAGGNWLRDAIQRLALAHRFCGYRRDRGDAAARGLGGQPQAGAAVDARG
ncbi:transposase [Inquilinus sp. 2KB_23]|uniref:transposase n=1 Tax=Inquilinus sp. 2KB_23 TaxID=3232979 RepID=UPI003F913F0F